MVKPLLKSGRIFFAWLLLLSYSGLAQQQPRANIVLIIADDVRYDSFESTGGPSFFDVPAIERISSEGANFHNFYTTYALCIPSRASIFSGVYPHLNKAYDNTMMLDPHFPTISMVLDSFGYHNGLIGKYHLGDDPQRGYEFWFATAGATVDYEDPMMNYMDSFIQYYGHITDLVADTAAAFLHRVDTPFMMVLGHLAPHKPVVPLPQYDGYYAGETMPLPENFFRFKNFYPSFLYDGENKFYEDTAELVDDLIKYYEGLKGIDRSIDSVFAILEARELLENTLIIFMGDHGALYGDHTLKGKGLPYEPSMKIPVFMRYPKWFPAPVEYFNSQFFALNLDVMPTIMDAAKINTGLINHLQGIPIRKLIMGFADRDRFMFEKIKRAAVDSAQEDEEDITPSLRTIRTVQYKYTRYHCQGVTEEFFDLVKDPLEAHNQILNPAYKEWVEAARYSLDSLQEVFLDTIENTIDTVFRECWLVKNVKINKTPKDSFFLNINRNPVENRLRTTVTSGTEEPVQLQLINLLGQAVYSETLHYHAGFPELTIDVSGLPAGWYHLYGRQGSSVAYRAVIKQ